MQHELAYTERDKAFLADLRHGGGSVIVGPDSSVLAGPMEGTEEGILSAEIDLEQTVRAKHIHDYAGHYNRSDVFTLRINRRVGQFVDDSHGVGPFEVLQERDDAELSAELQPAVGP
jgi:aliphatic nitrilase